LARHLFALVVLPGTVAVWAPIWIARRWGITFTSPESATEVMLVVAGVLAVVIGLALFVASLRRFASTGKGTLAPWDPPRHLVVVGPYRYVRNPMISGVTLTRWILFFWQRLPAR
jgi:protein-S-isoprenylcysteine O-methyltransferase Ste14